MKKNYLTPIILGSFLALSSCAEVLTQIKTTASTQTKKPGADIGAGLKEALRVGTDSAVSKLNVTDGYFKDAAVKILLPNEIESAIANFKSKSFSYLGVTISGETLYSKGYPKLGIEPLKAKEDELILGINRAAESAAKEAKPILVNAITSMSIQDANSILFGEDTAATHYLRTNTYSQLFEKFEPKMEAALNSVKIGEKPVAEFYENFIADYNKILNTSVPSLSGNKTVASLLDVKTIAATDLSSYTTNKGLSGLFLKVSEKEIDIRKNPAERVTALLKDVFGKLDN